MNEEERITKIEEAILLMKDLIVRHEDRLDNHNGKLDEYYKAMRESRQEFEFKMNALVDSQIRTEAEIIELRKTSESHSTRIENPENKSEK